MIENKPITLMTGLPGSGKTALIVKFIQKAVAEGRPVFQTGIPELKLPYIPVPPLDTWTELREDPENPGVMCPYFTFPERALIILSEAQRIYRPRPSGSKVPEHVAAFETVRHTGVTFIFDTQHPDFIDGHVRKLVGQHIHLLDHGVLGRWHYEWPYIGHPERFKEAPVKKKFSLPKEVFGLYKSSSLHIKRKYTIPPAVVALVLLTLVLVIGGWRFFNRINAQLEPSKETAQQTATAQPAVIKGQAAAVDPVAMLQEFVPAVPGRPETAPAYDALRQVKTMPYVVGCIQSKRSCSCTNQQGLDAGLDDLQCRNWLARPPFNPYREEPAPAAPPVEAKRSDPPSVDHAPAPSPAGTPT